jgi:hypothetical protein
MRPYLEKNPSQKRVGGGVGLEFKPQSHKKKKKKEDVWVVLKTGSYGSP